uniref:Uncharacterized protein n=1 Tax=Nelumbo nucifera TaxID=4432 RepID=A0A822Y7E4_NELNU|nr:TPA_asm: hypothetical protein HUJ06_029630 [Nelumbo nucifera]
MGRGKSLPILFPIAAWVGFERRGEMNSLLFEFFGFSDSSCLVIKGEEKGGKR